MGIGPEISVQLFYILIRKL